MSADSAWMLANALVRISTPDSPAKPPRNEQSLFIRRKPQEFSSQSPEQSSRDLITLAEKSLHTSVSDPNTRLKASSSLTSYHGTNYSNVMYLNLFLNGAFSETKIHTQPSRDFYLKQNSF